MKSRKTFFTCYAFSCEIQVYLSLLQLDANWIEGELYNRFARYNKKTTKTGKMRRRMTEGEGGWQDDEEAVRMRRRLAEWEGGWQNEKEADRMRRRLAEWEGGWQNEKEAGRMRRRLTEWEGGWQNEKEADRMRSRPVEWEGGWRNEKEADRMKRMLAKWEGDMTCEAGGLTCLLYTVNWRSRKEQNIFSIKPFFSTAVHCPVYTIVWKVTCLNLYRVWCHVCYQLSQWPRFPCGMCAGMDMEWMDIPPSPRPVQICAVCIRLPPPPINAFIELCLWPKSVLSFSPQDFFPDSFLPLFCFPLLGLFLSSTTLPFDSFPELHFSPHESYPRFLSSLDSFSRFVFYLSSFPFTVFSCCRGFS